MSTIENILVPDLGGVDSADVVEILVTVGDTVAVEDSLITLEGDKATMDVPSPKPGVVKEVFATVGDKISTGDPIVSIELSDAVDVSEPANATETNQAIPVEKEEKGPMPQQAASVSAPEPTVAISSGKVYAGPAVRRLATQLGVDLSHVSGTGVKGRILKADLHQFVKQAMQAGSQAPGGGFDFPALPEVDFSAFGPVDTEGLNKIKKISGPNLHRNWVSIPHVTQFDEADITELEAFRQSQKAIASEKGVRLTPLVFIMKAVVAALKEFPHFNASLSSDGESLILKRYFHIGVAVDTPNGLVVPVIRDVDQKGVFELAEELGAVSAKAREKGLTLKEMQGGCFTISSLGGIGGTAFTPIINAPEVAILGVSRSAQKPVYSKESQQFLPRLMLPLSLSYDHRVIDGADGARFMVFLSSRLNDLRTILL